MTAASTNKNSLSVSEAVDRRASIRGFEATPVSDDLIRELLEKSSRAPSGGNVQPWRIYVVNGDSMARLRSVLAETGFDQPEYDVYPPSLIEPYRTARFELGEQMYELLGIGRDDKPARLARMAENYDFFGAPAGFFCYVDRIMGPPQWSDLGMFLQTFMLLAVEAGLDTCPQEAWAMRHATITEFVGAPDNEMLFCGMAIGHRSDVPVNTLRSERFAVDDFTTWV